MTERPGDRALGGRYRMAALLAAGGMGEVWAAEDVLLGRPVAVKLLGPALAGDGRAAERLRREARAAARLVHPNIAGVLDLGEQDGRPYLVMELLEGESLAARLSRAGPMAPAEAAEVAAAVADALEVAHGAGVVHRDVKPGNVFLTTDGEVKVVDFGIASAAGDAALTTGDLLGTAAYLAPERVLGHRATPAADVYALGVLLYELLAGCPPFRADSDIAVAMAHVNARPVPLRQVAPWVPAYLVAACHHALAKDPAARPPSAAAFAGLLRTPASSSDATRPPAAGMGAAVTRPVPVAAPSPARPHHPGRRRAGGWVAALLLVGAVLAAWPALGGGWPREGGSQAERPAVGGQGPGGQVPGPTSDSAAGGAGGGATPTVGDGDAPGRGRAADDDHDQAGESGGSGTSGGDGPGRGGSSGHD
jgi:eukaryotic-like serine/threonine-protein kinase